MPDEGLFHFLRLGEALEGRLDALGALRDNPPGIAFLARLLGSGRLLGEVLTHVPEELAAIADPDGPGHPKDRERLVHEARRVARVAGSRGPPATGSGVSSGARCCASHLPISAQTIDQAWSVIGLADLADACLEAALDDLEVPVHGDRDGEARGPRAAATRRTST